MYVQINDIDRNIYMIASVVIDDNKIIYKMINGTQLQEEFSSASEAEAKYEEVISMTGGGIPLDEDGKIPAEYLPSYVDDIEDLVAVSSTAPATCSKGDKYYNTGDKKIYIATANNTWGSVGKTPESDKIYLDTSANPAISYRWSGTDLVAIGQDLSNYVSLDAAQTITGVKTFSALPESSVAPTTNNQLTNKAYVDQKSVPYQPFPSGIITSGTTQQMITSIQALNLPEGSMYLGGVTLSDMPFVGNAEVEVYVYPNNVIYLTLKSSNVSPYIWTCNSHTYRGWEPLSNKVFSGKLSEHTTEQTAVNLNNLQPGAYIYENDTTSTTSFYVKASFGDKTNIVYTNISPGEILILTLVKAIKTNPSSNETFAYMSKGIVINTGGGNGARLTFAPDRLYANNTGYLNIERGVAYEFVDTGSSQIIRGLKTFNQHLPESSLVPTANNQLVNKKYVDDNLVNIQYSTMPTAGVDFLDEIIQYTGTTSNDYTKGYFYVCESDGGEPATYSWTQINVQPQGSSPSPILPENGTRLLRKAATGVSALSSIQDAQVQDACLVLTDEVIEQKELVPFEFLEGVEEGDTIKFPRPHSFTFDGDVSTLAVAPMVNLALIGDNVQDLEQAQEWLGYNISGPNPVDNSSWYMFEFIAGPSSPAADLRNLSGIIAAWVCADPTTDPTFVYMEDGEEVAALVDSFGYDVYDYGMEEYTVHANLSGSFDGIANVTSGQYTYKDFIPLEMNKVLTTTETFKKSDLYVYDGSEWVYTDRNLSANANWDENDPTAPGYVRGRTHYSIPGTGETYTTVNVDDEGYDFEITESYEMLDNVYFDAYCPGVPVEGDTAYTTLFEQLGRLASDGYVGIEHPFILKYGTYEKEVFMTVEEEAEPYFLMYSIYNADVVLPETEGDPISNLIFTLEVTKRYDSHESVMVYDGILDILASIYQEQGGLREFELATGKDEIVVKLDPKYVPNVADWSVNDPTAPGYIANRTHYREGSGKSEDLGTEDLTNFDVNTTDTEENIMYYDCRLLYDENLESPFDTDGDVAAKNLFNNIASIYSKYSGNVNVSIKIGSIIVSGKLLNLKRDLGGGSSVDLYVVAVDGGELDTTGEGNPTGDTLDTFMTDSANSKGVMLIIAQSINVEQS